MINTTEQKSVFPIQLRPTRKKAETEIALEGFLAYDARDR